jgi:tetratricopeptide (TPR) repeat protein
MKIKILMSTTIFVFLLIALVFSQENSGELKQLSDAVTLMVGKDYDSAINVLKSIDSTNAEITKKVNYYLSECYFAKKDFLNTITYGEKVIRIGDKDFYYHKSLYNVIFSSYMVNDFEKTIKYSSVYLDEFDDTQSLEGNVLTMFVNSLQAIGKTGEALKVLENYKDKYPNLYSSIKQSLELASSQKQGVTSGELKANSKLDEVELQKTISDIKEKLEKISSKRDIELEKLESIIELLSLKEEVLKLKKYKMLSE